MFEYNIWFTTLKLSNKIKLQLLKNYTTAENVWKEFNGSILSTSEITNVIRSSFNREKTNDIRQIMFKRNINLVLYNEENYPQRLKEIEDSPAALYYIGDIEKLKDGIHAAVVGSRNCTSYGRNVTQIITSELSKQNIGIISGMAKGIDTCAHNAALENKGFTAAVLGCGIDVIYPKENRALYEVLSEKGCIISEFLPGTEPYAYNFPARNRIISGLSNIVIVVEAGCKSGSLITATQAIEQGKDVLAVPGQIFSSQSKGTNKLIKDGAFPLTCMEDVFDLLSMNYIKGINNKLPTLSDSEKNIYKMISDTPIHIDEIIKTTHIDIKHLYEVLFDLQLKNEIMCLAGNYYVKISKSI
jgi:DNA processing protein